MSQNIDRFLIQLADKDPALKDKTVGRTIDIINQNLREVPFSRSVNFLGAYASSSPDEVLNHLRGLANASGREASMDNVFKKGVVFGASEKNKKFTQSFGRSAEQISKIAGFHQARLGKGGINFLTQSGIALPTGDTPTEGIFMNLGSRVGSNPTAGLRVLLHEIGHGVSSAAGFQNNDPGSIDETKRGINEILRRRGSSSSNVEDVRSLMKNAISGYALEEVRAEQFAYENIDKLIRHGKKVDLSTLGPSYLRGGDWDSYLERIFTGLGSSAVDHVASIDPEIMDVMRLHSVGTMLGGYENISGEVGENISGKARTAAVGMFNELMDSKKLTPDSEEFLSYKKIARDAYEDVKEKGFRTVLSDPMVGEISNKPVRPRISVAASPGNSATRTLGRQSSDLIEVAADASRAVASGTSGSRALRTAGAALSILRRKI